PTGTTCQQYRDGTSQTLSAELYQKKGNSILNVTPGVFFLYDGVNLSTAGGITVTQSNTSLWSQAIGMQKDQAMLYRLDCVRLQGVTVTSSNGTVTISNVPAGSYIMSVKYDPGTLVGFTPPTQSTTYQFAVQVNSVSSGGGGGRRPAGRMPRMTPHRLGFLSLVIALGLASAAHARRVEISGPVEVIQVDDFDYGRSRLIHRIRDERTGRQYELEGASPELRH